MTEGYLAALIAVWAGYAVAALVPGPNVLCVASNALMGGARRGCAAAAGVAVATLLWILAGLIGLHALLDAWPGLMPVLRLLGAGVLVWMGWSTLRCRAVEGPGLRDRGAFAGAVLTGCSNPLNGAIWMTMAGLVLVTGPTAAEIGLYVLSCFGLGLAIYMTVALSLARMSFACAHRMDVIRKVSGGIFIFLAGTMVGS